MVKGTLQQFMDAVQNRIAELSDESYSDLAAATDITAETLYRIEDDCMGVVGDKYSEDYFKQMFEGSKGDPVIDGYDGDFNAWFKDTVDNGYLKRVDAATSTCNISGRPITAYEDAELSGEWVELSSKSVKDSDGFWTDYTLYAYEGDPSDVEYPYLCMFGDKDIYTPDEGYADWSGETEEEAWDWFNNYESYEDIESAEKVCASEAPTSDEEMWFDNYEADEYPDLENISQSELDRLYEIADRYSTSDPVSGDWDTETVHEQKAISDELGISMDDARNLMIEYLGFPPEEFN